jgi:hypothetical protein
MPINNAQNSQKKVPRTVFEATFEITYDAGLEWLDPALKI